MWFKEVPGEGIEPSWMGVNSLDQKFSDDPRVSQLQQAPWAPGEHPRFACDLPHGITPGSALALLILPPETSNRISYGLAISDFPLKTAPFHITKQGVRIVPVTWLDPRSSTRCVAVMFPWT